MIQLVLVLPGTKMLKELTLREIVLYLIVENDSGLKKFHFTIPPFQ